MIKYSEEEMKLFKKQIEDYSIEIVNSLNKIYFEFENMDEYLYTPKFKKNKVEILSYLKDRESFLENAIEKNNFKMQFIIDNYDKYLNEVKGMIGGSDD